MESWKDLTASDLMTENPRTVRMNAPVGEAVDILQSIEARHLPVVDGSGALVGMLSDRDLRSLEVPYAQDNQTMGTLLLRARTPVSSLMSSNVISVEVDAEVAEIMELLLENKIGAVPVVDGDGALVGIVSYQDVLRGILEAE